MGKKFRILFGLFITVMLIITVAVGAVLGSLQEIKDSFFGWLGDNEGQYKNQTEAIENWLNSISDEEFNFSDQAINKEKFKMYIESEKNTYFNDIGMTIKVYKDGYSDDEMNYTLKLYDATFEHRMPWQLIAGLDILLGESDSKNKKYIKQINKLFQTEYYGLTTKNGAIKFVDSNDHFKFYKEVTKTTSVKKKKINKKTGEIKTSTKTYSSTYKYPLPYFTKIKTPFETYEYTYEIETHTTREKKGNTTYTTIITEPVLKNVEVSDNTEEFMQKIRSLKLGFSDMEDLAEIIKYMPYGDQILPKFEKMGIAVGDYGGDYYYGPGDVTISDGVLLWPVPQSSRITSPFGMRFHPIKKKWIMHKGMDIGGKTGYDIVAADDGKVIRVAYDADGYGYWIEVQHDNNMTTRYPHLSKQFVKVGDEVKRGQIIGKMGSTGSSTGPHLHFEIRISGIPQDPAKYVGVVSNIPSVLPEDLKYKDINIDKAVEYLSKRNSYLANKESVKQIVQGGNESNINPLLLIAITGQEMSYVKNDYKYWIRVYGENNLKKKLKGLSSSAKLKDAPKYITNNPFNVYGAWWLRQPGLKDSARIAGNTINKLSKNRPKNIDPIKWLNMPRGVNPNGFYAEHSEWHSGVRKNLTKLIKEVGYIE